MKYKKNNYYYWVFGLITCFVSAFILAEYSINFPDFHKYDRYIIENLSLTRFYTDPLSALMMQIVYLSGLDGHAYYLLVILTLNISYLFLASNFKSSGSLFILVFLIFNPLNLLMIHTPRFACAFAICIYALYRNDSTSKYFLLLSFFFHNIMGVFAIALFLMKKVKPPFLVFLVSCCILGIFLISRDIIPLGYGKLSNTEDQRGLGRLLIFIVLYAYFILSMKINDQNKTYLCILGVMIFALYFISPFTHRFGYYVLIVCSVRFFSNFKYLLNSMITHVILTLFLILSIYIMVEGLYGYGPKIV